MKNSNLFAIAMMVFVGFASLTVSAPAEAAYKTPCKYRFFDTDGKCAKKQSSIVDRHAKEYLKYSGYKAQEQKYIDNAVELTNREAELTVAKAIRTLSRDENRELSRIGRKIDRAYKYAEKTHARVLKSGMKLIKYKRDYKEAGGKGDLSDVSSDTMSDALNQ